jgi:hypothetical protein
MEVDNGKVFLPDRTSPTNIGLYLYAVSCAKRLDLIDQVEAVSRVKQTLTTLSQMERHHGFYLNWYKASTASTMREWEPGRSLVPFLSSVDNAWLAISLFHVEHEYPQLAALTSSILDTMDFRFFYDEAAECFYGGYDTARDKFTDYHYRILNSETRLISYVAIHAGQVPKSHLNKLIRTKQDGRLLSCYGSMFEALAVSLFVPEIEQSPFWRAELANYLDYQIENSIDGIWGISYSDDTKGVYKEFGLKKLSQYPTHFEIDGVVTPYASFLATQINPELALVNIARLSGMCYCDGYGFFGAYRPATKERSKSIFTLEQGCIMMTLADMQKENPSKKIFEGMVCLDFQ